MAQRLQAAHAETLERERRWNDGEYPKGAYDLADRVIAKYPDPKHSGEPDPSGWRRHVALEVQRRWRDDEAPPEDVEQQVMAEIGRTHELLSGPSITERLGLFKSGVPGLARVAAFKPPEIRMPEVERATIVPNPSLGLLRDQREAQIQQTAVLQQMLNRLDEQASSGRFNTRVSIVSAVAAVVAAVAAIVVIFL